MSDKHKVMKWHSLCHYLYTKHVPVIPRVMHIMGRIIFGCSIPPKVDIKEGTRLAHNGLGVVIHDDAIIGQGTVILQNVSIGGKNGQGPPVIGDYCYIGAGACVLGEIKIGNDVMIGANAVVTHDVEDGMVVAGVPARVIGKTPEEYIGKQKH